MPVCSNGTLTVDYTEDGAGETVVLIHSSVSGNRQWRTLVDALKERFRLLAINLFGYGETTPWPGTRPQALADQAELVLALCERTPGPIHIVGHSFGGSVAAWAAAMLGPRAGRLVLLEPNPFYLLKQEGRTEAYETVRALRDHVKKFGAAGDWARAGEKFADYWLGDGSWASMPEKRRQAFTASVPPVFHEWDAVMNEETTIAAWKALEPHTMVVSASGTRRPIREIVELLADACPHWTYAQVAEGGHMAPVARPELVNPIIARFLDREE
jgi:pimeloyl-ACP methyl ester carboxylesterase